MTDKELKELESIRRLLMLLIFKIGGTQEEVAMALDVTQARVSQMLSTAGIKRAEVECLVAKGTENR